MIPPKKSLGQHFLHDQNILHKITQVGLTGITPNEQVTEVGGGKGALTEALLKHSIPLTVVEKDDRFIPLLVEMDINLVHDDALKHDFAAGRIVANLPYNVATPLIIGWMKKIHQNPKHFSRITVLIQKEVANRLTAQPNTRDWGRLGALCQWLCDVDTVFDVPPTCFSPPPKVMSAVVTMTPLHKPRYPATWQALENILQKAFAMRRKMLRQSLKGFDLVNIDSTRRPETLTLQEFCELAR